MYTKGKGFQPRPVSDTSRQKTKKKPAPASGSAAAGPPSASGSAAEPMDDDEVAASMVPDYGFPIVYYFVTHAELTSPQLAILNAYINVQTNACNRRPGDSSTHPFLMYPTEICVLFMYWDISHHLEVLKTTNMGAFQSCLSDTAFLNRRILGHAKIAKNFPYLSIYNFCKHSVTISPSGVVTQRDPQFGPIGIAMFNALLTATTFLQAPAPAIDAAAVVVDAAVGSAVVVDAAAVGPAPAIDAAAVVVDAAAPAAGGAANTLWLGIHVSNPDFSKVAKIYTICGFSNPIITNLDVTGAPLPFITLQLTRPLHAHTSSHSVSVQNYNQTMNLMHKWNASTRPQVGHLWQLIGTSEINNLARYNARIMKYKFSFDRSCILSLHLFPFVSFNERGLATGVTHMHGQRETSGKFVVTQSLYDQTTPEEGHDVLALETTVSSPSDIRLNFNVGSVESVPMVFAEATFHTHPIANYKIHKTIIGPPSGGDFLAFVQSFVNLQLTFPFQSFKFSLVSTIEGVHIISLTPAGIIFFIGLMRTSQSEAAAQIPPGDAFALFISKVDAITRNYEYRFEDRPFIWEHHDIDEARSQDALYAVIGEYREWFNRVNQENGGVFNWSWTSWDEFNVDDIIEVYYLENRIRIRAP